MNSLPKTDKSLGQHWLHDFATLSHIVEVADINPGDMVLEVGPGTGALTKVLLSSGAYVTAVEFDERLIKILEEEINKLSATEKENFKITNQDILKFDFRQLPESFKVVANIPYYLTSKLIRILSELPNQPTKAILLIQKEVAQRVAAKPGDMSLLSVSAQYYWRVSLGNEVPAKLFTPPPKVDSQVLILDRREKPLFPDVDSKRFFRIVKAGFSNRRKTLLNSLSGGLQLDKGRIKKILESADINPNSRPQELSLDRWHELYKHID